MAREPISEVVDNHIEELFREVISKSHEKSKEDVVARALLFLLVRVSNSWRTIRTLQKNTPDKEGYAVDAGTLLRAAFDAYLQAEYIFAEEAQRVSRAKDYFDFEHIERYKYQATVLSFDNWLSNSMKSSSRRKQGEKQVQEAYERVRERFLTKKKKTRIHWYPGTLPDIATDLRKDDEYRLLLSSFNGCVHSSATAVTKGPLVSGERLLSWASTVVARVARLSVLHNDIELTELHKRILDKLSTPYF